MDILVEFNDGYDFNDALKALTNDGFIVMPTTNERVSLNYGYTKHGYAKDVFHIHLRKCGDIDEVYFKDYLNANPDIAKEYENLKLSLAKKYVHDRDAYTNAKSEFVNKWNKIAKDYYRNQTNSK